jgi:hypothetical protein
MSVYGELTVICLVALGLYWLCQVQVHQRRHQVSLGDLHGVLGAALRFGSNGRPVYTVQPKCRPSATTSGCRTGTRATYSTVTALALSVCPAPSAGQAVTGAARHRPAQAGIDSSANPATQVADSPIPIVRRLKWCQRPFHRDRSHTAKPVSPPGARARGTRRRPGRLTALAGRAGIGCARPLIRGSGARRRAALLQAGVACGQHQLGGDQRVDQHSGAYGISQGLQGRWEGITVVGVGGGLQLAVEEVHLVEVLVATSNWPAPRMGTIMMGSPPRAGLWLPRAEQASQRQVPAGRLWRAAVPSSWPVPPPRRWPP